LVKTYSEELRREKYPIVLEKFLVTEDFPPGEMRRKPHERSGRALTTAA
jgi:hypothetical protein